MLVIKKTLFIAVVSLFCFVSCSPEDGATGPVGPIGQEGPIGPRGPAGEDGDDGVANVEARIFSVPSSDWSTGARKTTTLSVPAITKEVVDEGTIQVFQSESTNPDSLIWASLSHSETIGVNTGGGVIIVEIITQFEYFTGEVYLSVINNEGLNITNSANFPGDRTFKVIVIPPSEKVEGLDYSDYEAVKLVHGLEN